MSTLLAAVPSLHGAAEVSAVGGWVAPVVVVSVMGGCYLGAVARHRERRGRAWSRWRSASWTAGAALVGAATSPPAEAAAAMATGHMVQHVVLGMLAPVALVLGAPVTLLLATSTAATGRRIGRLLRSRAVHALGHPVTAATLSVGGMYVLYLTPLYAVSTSDDTLHHAVHLHFLAAGYLFAWSVAGPDPAPRRPSLRTRVVVLVLAAGAHSHLAKLLYARADELPPGGTHSPSQVETAAQWMYYGGDVALVLLAAALFAGWYRRAGRSLRVGAHGPTSAVTDGVSPQTRAPRAHRARPARLHFPALHLRTDPGRPDWGHDEDTGGRAR